MMPNLQVFAFTAPYSQRIEKNKESKVPSPWYRPEDGLKFIEAHGLGVRAVGEPMQACTHMHMICMQSAGFKLRFGPYDTHTLHDCQPAT